MKTLVVLLSLIVVPVIAKSAEPSKAPWKPTVEKMWQVHSKHRELNGLKPQELHPELTRAAQAWADKMAKNGWFCHSTYSLNENIAWGQETPERAMQAWIYSPGHNSNLLSNYPHCGFGVAKSANGTYWVSLHANLKEGQKISESYGCSSSSGRRRWFRRR